MTMMKNESVNMTYDDKILSYKGKDYEEFMALFDKYDITEMYEYMDDIDDDFDYNYLTAKEVKEVVVANYIKGWVNENILHNVTTGTK